MTKVLTVDDLEIEFEKQNTDHACKWCVYIRLRKKDKEQTILMIRTNNKPYTRFTAHLGNIVNQSKETLKDVLALKNPTEAEALISVVLLDVLCSVDLLILIDILTSIIVSTN